MTKFLNIDLDTKLGGSTPSDVLVSSQKAIKTYVDSKLLEETTRAQGVEAGLDTRVSTNEDDIAMNKDEIGTLTTDMSTAKTDITNLKNSVNTQANLISDLQDSKQDKIDNLDTIVAGAAAGATAVQPSAIADMETKTHASATYQPKGDYALTSSVNTVATKVSGIEAKIPDSASADNKLATKADLENVSVAVDGTTITKKADGKIQASAVINQNTGVLKSWTGTLAEYNALETKSDDTIYVITDDDSEGVNVYTKSEVDDLLNNKQDTLVSGTNIKTINGETLLGSGDIKIEASSSGGGVSVGTVFVTPRTGTIPGAVEANGSSYSIADYSGGGSIGALLTAGSIAYVSKAEFQTQVTNTGACDSFGWDGADDTTFLVPKLNPWHVGKNAPVVGNGMTLGLTDGASFAGTFAPNDAYSVNQLTGSYGATVGTATPSGSGRLKGNTVIGVVSDPTKSGIIADLSETTNLRVMVQLATGTTDQALETCTSVLSDVSALNAHRVIEFQAPTAENNYTWYRKYADGWVEQGGVFNNSTNLITLPVAMANNKYICVSGSLSDDANAVYNIQFYSLTTTGFSARNVGSNAGWTGAGNPSGWWQVSGMAE